jgi:hypothetical protein
MRYCRDIGLWAIDRPIPVSCVHATEYCKKTCYNSKLYRAFPSIKLADERYELEWQNLDPRQVKAFLASRRKPVTRMRLMTRGEAFRDHSDIGRTLGLLREMPDVLFWIPTRAWRDPLLRLRIEQEILPEPNAAVLASTDPTTGKDDYESLRLSGWSTMHYGGPSPAPKPFHCPKTAAHLTGACAVCINGCFKQPLKGQRVDVYLDQH